MTDAEIKNLVIQYKELAEQKKKLEEELKKYEERLDDIKDKILTHMQEHALTSLRFKDVGQVVASTRDHYEIRDRALFAKAVLAAMIDGYNAGRPLDDALIAQTRVSKESLQIYLDSSKVTLSDCGLTLVQKPILQIRKN